jgi:hypothetical protein
VLLVLGFAPQSTNNLYITIALLATLMIVYSIILFRKQIFKKKAVK